MINGLTDLSHPCQILADLHDDRGTARRRSTGKTIAWLGDGNNVCASFVHAAAKLGFTLRIATPDGLRAAHAGNRGGEGGGRGCSRDD